MPSFDVVSEVDTHELTNAIDQANRELSTRFDFKGVDAKFERSLEFGDIETNLAQARQKITVKQGIEQKIAKKIAAALKDAKLKVESQINGDKLRVQGKKRDDLQDAIAVLKAGKFELPLQFNNFRD
ncbi:MAG: nucleotide-binding protein [Stenotrophomonas sp.]|nr:nucleotide-binding protein [Stenotrophomonas sp.]